MTAETIKAAARDAAYLRRKAAHAARSVADASHLVAVLRAHAGKALAGYMPMRTEIDCLPAMAAHRGPVGVPVIEGKAIPLRFRVWSPAARMVAGVFGAQIPEAGDWIEPDVLIVPLLAFDRRGFRLGYGGGYYDRTLELLRGRKPIVAIGFGFAAQEVPEVPIEPTDQRLDLVVTEKGVIRPVS